MLTMPEIRTAWWKADVSDYLAWQTEEARFLAVAKAQYDKLKE